MDRNNYYNEQGGGRRMQPNTDRNSRWAEEDDRSDERYSRDDSEQDRFNKYTRGAPYSTYGNMNQSSGNADNQYRGSSNDYGRGDYSRYSSEQNNRDPYQGYRSSGAPNYEQSPYQNFGRPNYFSESSRSSSGYNQGGTYNYGGHPSGMSNQNQFGSQGFGSSYNQGSDQGWGGQGQRSFNTQNQGWGSSRYSQSFNPGYGNQSYGSQNNGYGNQNYGNDYYSGSNSNYSRYGNESQSAQGHGISHNAAQSGESWGQVSPQYRGQNYSSGSNSSDWGHRGNYQSSPWSSSDRDRSMSSRSGKAPKGYKRSDERIKEEVCDLLTNAPHVDPSEIEIKVANGEVTLTGSVEDRMEKRMVEDLAATISGVTEVHNQLRVSGQNQSGNRSNSASSLTDTRSDSSKSAPGTGNVKSVQ